LSLLRAFLADTAGSMVIETAIVAPVLGLLSLGAFQASAIVARQQELQSGAAEAANIVLAAQPTTQAQLDAIRTQVAGTLSLPETQVVLTNKIRCDDDGAYSDTPCGSEEITATYVEIVVTDTYDPIWTSLGIGNPVGFNVKRTVQIS